MLGFFKCCVHIHGFTATWVPSLNPLVCGGWWLHFAWATLIFLGPLASSCFPCLQATGTFGLLHPKKRVANPIAPPERGGGFSPPGFIPALTENVIFPRHRHRLGIISQALLLRGV